MLSIDDVRDLLQAACEKEGSQISFAAKYGLSAQYVSDVLRGRRKPGAAMLRALGLRRLEVYEMVKKIKKR